MNINLLQLMRFALNQVHLHRCLSTENVNKIISINETQDTVSNIKGTFFIGYLF